MFKNVLRFEHGHTYKGGNGKANFKKEMYIEN